MQKSLNLFICISPNFGNQPRLVRGKHEAHADEALVDAAADRTATGQGDLSEARSASDFLLPCNHK